MKKLFTFVALLAMFLGTNAKQVVDVEVDYSKFDDGDASTIKFYGWGASESAKQRLSIKNGCLHFESTEAVDPAWDCQFHPIGGVIVMEGGVYTLHYKVKGSVDQNISALGFGQTPYGQFPIMTEWVEGKFEYRATDSSSGGDILFQCGDYVGEWDIAYLKITHEEDEDTSEEWEEMLTNGDAETPWPDPYIKFDDSDKNYTVCAWSKVKGVNLNATNGWDPFPATIEEDPDNPGNHVFVVHAAFADTDGDASAWDNQFWIESPQAWKQGSKVMIHFRYKASRPVHTNTQIHRQTPSDYLWYVGVGDVDFTPDWQVFEKTIIFDENQAGGWSIAFNLNPDEKTPTDFYFDDLSWKTVVLDEGFFVTACYESEPDYGGLIKFDEKDGLYTATIGTADNYVSDIMIFTYCGTHSLFMDATIKPTEIVEGEFVDYVEASSAVINLPVKCIWTITINPESKKIKFESNMSIGQTGIDNVTKKNKAATDMFNLAGQRVSNNYKGMVVDGNGFKYIAK